MDGQSNPDFKKLAEKHLDDAKGVGIVDVRNSSIALGTGYALLALVEEVRALRLGREETKD